MLLRIFFLIIIGQFFLFTGEAISWDDKTMGGPRRGDDYELELLPDYCRIKLKKNLEIAKQWEDRFRKLGERGTAYIHCHHYCQALLYISRIKRGVGDRSKLIGFAEGNLDYMLKHSSPKFVLMPEILWNMGYVQQLKGNFEKSNYYFKMAKKIKAKYSK